MGEDLVDRVDDALPGGPDDLLGGEVAGGLGGPAGDVPERVLRRIQAMRADDHERNSLSFNLPDTAAVNDPGRCGGVGHQDVTQFVGEHAGRHSLVDVVTDADRATRVAGDAVRGAAVSTFEPVPLLLDEFGQPVPQAGWRLAGEKHRLRGLRDRWAVALTDVEDRNGFGSDHFPGLPWPAVRIEHWASGGVEEWGASGDRSEDADRGLALAYLVALGLPRSVAGDGGRVRSLGHDCQPVQE